MEKTLYLVLAIAGGGILLVQVLMQVFGLAGEGDFTGAHDVGHLDATGHDGGAGSDDGSWYFGVLSFKALVAFAGFFGLTGMALLEAGWSPGLRAVCATGAGLAGMVAVAFLMRSLTRLSSSGTLQLANAVGAAGSVYLRIPARGEGAGKVTLEVQGRSIQVDALTDGEAIPTGARVQVIALVGEDTLKVIAA
jgi:hypothetical protein